MSDDEWYEEAIDLAIQLRLLCLRPLDSTISAREAERIKMAAHLIKRDCERLLIEMSEQLIERDYEWLLLEIAAPLIERECERLLGEADDANR